MTTQTNNLNEDMTYHESFGTLPVHILRMTKRFNVSPSDYQSLCDAFGTDWDAMRECILDNLTGSSFSTFKAGI